MGIRLRLCFCFFVVMLNGKDLENDSGCFQDSVQKRLSLRAVMSSLTPVG